MGVDLYRCGCRIINIHVTGEVPTGVYCYLHLRGLGGDPHRNYPPPQRSAGHATTFTSHAGTLYANDPPATQGYRRPSEPQASYEGPPTQQHLQTYQQDTPSRRELGQRQSSRDESPPSVARRQGSRDREQQQDAERRQAERDGSASPRSQPPLPRLSLTDQYLLNRGRYRSGYSTVTQEGETIDQARARIARGERPSQTDGWAPHQKHWTHYGNN